MTIFTYKKDAISYYNRTNKTDLLLFQIDTNISGTKKFIVINPSIIFHTISNNNTDDNNNYYEFWSNDMQMSFGMDIDINDGITEYESLQVVKKLIKNVIDGCLQFYNYKINI